MRNVRAAMLYFLTVFAAGFLLGPIRVLLLEPWLGPLAAVLCEAPVMIAAMFLAARWAVRRHDVPNGEDRIVMGAFAFGLLILAEFSGSVLLRGDPPAAYLQHLTTPAGLVSLVLFVLFGAMPSWVHPRLPVRS